MKNNKLLILILALLVCFSLVVTVSAASELTIAVEASASTVGLPRESRISRPRISAILIFFILD